MDKTGIKEIHDNAAAIELGSRVLDCEYPVAALPENFSLHSLEPFQKLRNRFRGKFNTPHIDSFIAYFSQHKVPLYVDQETMSAKAIFNAGDTNIPGHCDHVSTLQLKKTAAFVAFEGLAQRGNSSGLSQRELAEWIEDWREYLTAIDEENNSMDVKQLVGVVRRITIDRKASSDSSEKSFSSNRAAIESIEASSAEGKMPKVIIFTTNPYHDLADHEFKFRISIRTGGDKITFGVFRIQPEKDQEVIAEDFINTLKYKLESDDVIYQGKFDPT